MPAAFAGALTDTDAGVDLSIDLNSLGLLGGDILFAFWSTKGTFDSNDVIKADNSAFTNVVTWYRDSSGVRLSTRIAYKIVATIPALITVQNLTSVLRSSILTVATVRMASIASPFDNTTNTRTSNDPPESSSLSAVTTGALSLIASSSLSIAVNPTPTGVPSPFVRPSGGGAYFNDGASGVSQYIAYHENMPGGDTANPNQWQNWPANCSLSAHLMIRPAVNVTQPMMMEFQPP